MLRRAVWFGAGAVSAVWAQHKAKRVAQRFTPPAIASSAAEAARSKGRTVAAALHEGRSAMRAREAELRAGFAQDLDPDGPGASIHTLTPRGADTDTGEDVVETASARAERRRGERRRAPGPPS